MHYGGNGFHAHDKTTHKLIGINKKLSPLDIKKLNHYYPPISKLAPAETTLESRANSNEIRLSSLYQNRSHRNEDLSKCESDDYQYATSDNFTSNDAKNNTIDDQDNYQIMVEFNKAGFPFYVLVSFVIGQDTVLKPI